MAPFFDGTISPQQQHDSVFTGTKYGTQNIPILPLMPLPISGVPTAGAAIQSGSTTTINTNVTAVAAGPNGAIQFNNGGALGGNSLLIWDNIGNALTIGGNVSVTGSVSITGSLILSGTVTAAVFNATTGFQVAGLATLGKYLRGNGTDIVLATLNGSDLLAGIVGVTYGGTGSNLSATGGAHEVLQQSSVGGAVTVGQLAFTDISGILSVAAGGTGTATPALVQGADITITGSWPDQTIAVKVQSGVVAGSYTSTNLTVDSSGIITAIANGSGGSTPSLDQVLNPVASKTFNLGANSLTFSGASSTSAITLSEAGSGGINLTNTGTGGLFIADTSTAGLNLSEAGAGNILIRSLVGSTGTGIQLENDAATGGITLLNNTTSSSGGGTAVIDNSGVGITVDDAGAGGVFIQSFKVSGAITGSIDLDTTGSPITHPNAVSITVAATNGLYMNGIAGYTHVSSDYTAFTFLNGIITAATPSSDERLKTNIKPFTAGLAAILKIDPITYWWDPERSGIVSDHEWVGFSAQNVQKVIPVATPIDSTNGYLEFNDKGVIAALVNAVKELTVRLVSLESRL